MFPGLRKSEQLPVILVLEMCIVPGLLTYLLVILKRLHWYHPPDFFFEVSEVKDYLI